MYKLIVRDLNGNRDEYKLDEKVSVIGRGDNVHVKLNSTKISRQHFRIFFKGLKIYIEDLNSANGVYINEEKLDKVSALSEEDIIRFGDLYAQLNNTNKIRKFFKIDDFVDSEIDSIRQKNIKPYYKLISQDKRYPGLEFDLEMGTTTVGRTRESNIVIPNETLSRKHVKLDRRGDKLYVEDLKSANGSMLNGRKIRAAKQVFDTDIIIVGDVEFVIESNIELEKKSGSKKKLIIFLVPAILILLLLMVFMKSGKGDKKVVKVLTDRDIHCKGLSSLDCDLKLKEMKIHKLLGDSAKYAKMSSWDEAIALCDKILEKDPRNMNAKKYKASYVKEKANKVVFDKANKLKLTSPEEALEKFKEIPEDSNYRGNAILNITKIKDELIRSYFSKAKALYKANRLGDSYEKLRALFKLTSFHDQAKELKQTIEARAKRYTNVKISKFQIDIGINQNKKAQKEDKRHELKKVFKDKVLYTAIDYYIRGDISYAISYLNRIGETRDIYKKAKVLLNRLQNIEMLYSRGMNYYSSKNLSRARTEWEKLLKEDKELLVVDVESSYRKRITDSLSDRFYEKGYKLFKEERMKSAYKNFKEALSFKPKNMQALKMLSRLQRGAENSWIKSLRLEKQGDKRAYKIWELIVGVTDKETAVHQKALKKLTGK